MRTNTSGSVAPPPGQGGGYGVWVGVAYSWSLLEQAALSAVTLSPWLYFASVRWERTYSTIYYSHPQACWHTLFILSYGITVSYLSLACNPDIPPAIFFANPLLNIGLVGSTYMTAAISLDTVSRDLPSTCQVYKGIMGFYCSCTSCKLWFQFSNFCWKKIIFC